ncbi:MAG: VanW family protein [Bacillota bacterium]|nr:VanW family protein [Bacillota bacterium]
MPRNGLWRGWRRSPLRVAGIVRVAGVAGLRPRSLRRPALAAAALLVAVAAGLLLRAGPPGGSGPPPAAPGSAARDSVAAQPGNCDPPGPPDRSLHAYVGEKELPWSASPPARLEALRDELPAPELIAAFRTTLPDPFFDEVYNVDLGARLLAGTVVPPGATFSLIGTIGPFTRQRGYRDGPTYAGSRIIPSVGGGVCKIASNLYNVVRAADLPVVERHPHSMLVPYVPPGQDATVASSSALDFRFRNDRTSPVLLWAGMRGRTLYIALYGDYRPPVVRWEHRELWRQKPWTVRVLNRSLPPGTVRVLVPGYDGVAVRTWIVVQYAGKPPERRDLGVDTYQPLPRVVEVGP